MDDNKEPGKLHEYKWVDVPKPCRICGGKGLYAGMTCGKCNGHGEYYVARLARRRIGSEHWIPVGGRWQS